MPDERLPDNSDLVSTFYNDNVREQVIATVTSSTRPTGTEGRLIYETDTNAYYVHTGSAWIGIAGEVPWIGVSYSNGWADTASYQGVEYRRVGDVVQVRGRMGTGDSTDIAFTLPTGYRPPASFSVQSVNSNSTPGVALLNVSSGGTVVPYFGGATVAIACNFRFSLTA